MSFLHFIKTEPIDYVDDDDFKFSDIIREHTVGLESDNTERYTIDGEDDMFQTEPVDVKDVLTANSSNLSISATQKNVFMEAQERKKNIGVNLTNDEYDSDAEFEINEDITDTEDFVEDVDDTDSEIEYNDDTIENEVVGETFISKSGFEWNSLPPLSLIDRERNFINKNTGLINDSKTATTIREMFSLFITETIVEEICHQTCRQLSRLSGKWIRPIFIEEIYAFIGIMLASGRNRTRKLSLDELWTNESPFCQPFFTAALSRDRFISIFSNIRFDDRETRQERFNASGNKLEAIYNIFNKFVDGCKSNYSAGSNITVGERLATFNGNCPFRVSRKTKPDIYGIRIWIVADSSTAYVLNLQVYTGTVNKRREINQRNRVVMDMVQSQYGTNRGVTTTKYFTSVPLADALLDKQLKLTGTIRKNKREVPKEFLPAKLRPVHSSTFGFTQTSTLVSYVPQQNKAVLMLTTQFHDAEVSKAETKKPEIILHYNRTKGAVDIGDKMTTEYSCVRSTRRWPFRLFMEMLDIAALNAYLLWTEKYPDWKKTKKSRFKYFIRELSLELAKPNIERRKNSIVKFHQRQQDAFETVLSYCNQISSETNSNIPQEISETNLNIPQKGISSESTTVVSRLPSRNCRFCPNQTKKRSRLICRTCQKPVCLDHRIEQKIILCSDCAKMKIYSDEFY